MSTQIQEYSGGLIELVSRLLGLDPNGRGTIEYELFLNSAHLIPVYVHFMSSGLYWHMNTRQRH